MRFAAFRSWPILPMSRCSGLPITLKISATHRAKFCPPGDPAEHLLILLEGEMQARSENGGLNGSLYIASAGEVSGLLPQSRMTTYSRTARTASPARIARLHKRHFDEMLAVIPQLGPRLLGVMADRIRETTRSDIQHEKLAALGKLSAGLAHELNNPASAAHNAAGRIREVLEQIRSANFILNRLPFSEDVWQTIADIENLAVRNASACTAMDALTRSDREGQLESALAKAGVDRPWELTSELVDAGSTLSTSNRSRTAWARMR